MAQRLEKVLMEINGRRAAAAQLALELTRSAPACLMLHMLSRPAWGSSAAKHGRLTSCNLLLEDPDSTP